MKLPLLIVVAVAGLAACATGPRQAGQDADGQTAGVVLDLPGYASGEQTRIVFDPKGEWQSISTVATAAVDRATSASHAPAEAAFLIATLRAKRTLAEFVRNDVRSESTTRRVERALIESDARDAVGERLADDVPGDLDSAGPNDARVDGPRSASRRAHSLVERISEQSAVILKGVHVTQRSLRDGVAVVEVSATRKSIDLARRLARQMGEGL